jgi:hypothetical protein
MRVALSSLPGARSGGTTGGSYPPTSQLIMREMMTAGLSKGPLSLTKCA